jgi:hypothetical protein
MGFPVSSGNLPLLGLLWLLDVVCLKELAEKKQGQMKSLPCKSVEENFLL